MKLANFGVAEWWVTENKIRPALSTTQFNDVTQFEFQTGSLAPPGTYSFQVHSITLHGRFISRATWYALILAAWVGLVTLYLIVRIFKLRQDLERRGQSQAAALRVAEYAEESARRDYLTRLLNRHGVIDLYHRMAMDRRREGTFAAILIDVDHFKQVNDCFGHAIGDQVLAGIANILSANMRSSDIVGRWGGEEFLLICNVGDHNAAFAIATKLREAIEANEFPMAGRVTASFGVYCGSGRMDALDQVTSCADAALYVAKEQGRNRVVMYKPSMRAAA
ncbi:MAG: GGDEF domain-containing protein [Asticcacaulis sp.]|nr:GGDEF domain-containing protein [Asticcacaulis sp.]